MSSEAAAADAVRPEQLLDPLVLFKVAVLNLASREHIRDIILDQLALLVGARCRLHRNDTLHLSTVQGTMSRFFAVASQKYGFRFKADLKDTTTGMVLCNSKLVVKWIYQYGQAKNKPLRLIGSGWQEVTIQLHAPDHPTADDQGMAWFPLSCIVSKELRDMSCAVLYDWLANLFPLREHRINTRERATAFLIKYAGMLATIDPAMFYDKVVATVTHTNHGGDRGQAGDGSDNEEETEQDKLGRQQVEQTRAHMKKTMHRNSTHSGLTTTSRKRKSLCGETHGDTTTTTSSSSSNPARPPLPDTLQSMLSLTFEPQ